MNVISITTLLTHLWTLVLFHYSLHEADAFKAPREYFMCQDYVTLDGDVYCKLPASQFQAATGQYCSTTHTDPATPGWEDGCNCALENPDPNPQLGENYVLAKKLYFGRGIQSYDKVLLIVMKLT